MDIYRSFRNDLAACFNNKVVQVDSISFAACAVSQYDLPYSVVGKSEVQRIVDLRACNIVLSTDLVIISYARIQIVAGGVAVKNIAFETARLS